MTKQIVPIDHPLNALIRVPGSKSITNRALICAALAKGETRISNFSDSDDTSLLANGLNQLGILVRRDGSSLLVEGKGGNLYAPKFPIPVGNAGTTLRFLVALAVLADRGVVFEGSHRMAARPIAPLLDALRRLGTESSFEDMFARYKVEGGNFVGGSTSITLDMSSQFISALLMIASYAKKDVSVEVTGEIRSTPYIDMTIDVMKHFGVDVSARDGKFVVRAGQLYKPHPFEVEPDASGASYFLAGAAICGGKVSISQMKRTSRQGDTGFLSVLESMGCEVHAGDEDISVQRNGELRSIEIDMNDMPDMVPTLAVLALFANGRTSIRNIGHLQHKESNRLEALGEELSKISDGVCVTSDSIEITPGNLQGARLDTHEDHRLAMSFALIGLRVPGIVVENPSCVSKSFPSFWNEFDKLYRRD